MIFRDVEKIADGRLQPINDRGQTLSDSNPATGTAICEGLAVRSDAVVDTFPVAFEYGPLNFEGVGSETTVFRSEGEARDFVEMAASTATRCGLRLRSPKLLVGSDETVRIVKDANGQQGIVLYEGEPQVDRVLARKSNVVIQIVMITTDADQSTEADGLAETLLRQL